MRRKIVAIIQARIASSRLPGKVLIDIAGQPMIAWVVERTRRAKTVDEVVVATTNDPSDDAVAALCEERGYQYYRGSTLDVIDRFYQAARIFKADIVVRITGDCPLIDPELVDRTVYALFGIDIENGEKQTISNKLSNIRDPEVEIHFDFTANRLPPPWGRTYPIGLDTEVCTFSSLERAWREADKPHQREHVMPYLYEEPGRFQTLLINHEKNYGEMRWTVDTIEDLELVRTIVNRFEGRDSFTWLDVLNLVEREPTLLEINAQVEHKTHRDVDARVGN